MTKLWTKKQTQKTIKDLRDAGYKVELISSGFYKCLLNKKEIFSAMIGNNGYLVKYDEMLFS